jgi:hypothetical protein
MNRLIRGIVLCALFLFAFNVVSFAADPIGKVVAVLGSPSASGPGGDRKLKADSAVFENDKISVGSSGNAQIILNDGTKLVVGPASSLVLDKFVMQSSSGKAESVAVKALRGTFRFITGKSAKSAYDISTSNATIGIRGTGFDFWVKSNTGVLVMEGSVNLDNRRGKSVVVRADCEMGRSTPSDARKLTGQLFGEAVRNNLPYILNQSRLRPAFRLPIENCRTLLSRANGATGTGSENGQGTQNGDKGGKRNNNGNTPENPPRNPNTCGANCR